jgi:hypothetical protein
MFFGVGHSRIDFTLFLSIERPFIDTTNPKKVVSGT